MLNYIFKVVSTRLVFPKMSYSFNGKIVLVTGAAGGIGVRLVNYLLDENVKFVAMLDVAEEAGIALQNELNSRYKEAKVKFLKCDVSDKERLLEAFQIVKEEVRDIDVVVNNAAILDDSPESFVKEININLVAVITSSLHAFNVMHKEKGGKGGTIINFSSVAALCKTVNVPIYGATKSGVLKFSTALGDNVHFSRSGVRVLTVCFGLTNTPMMTVSTKQLFDKTAEAPIAEDFKKFKIQSAESAGKAVIEVYKRGASGSVWVSTSDKPAQDITEIYDRSVDLFSDYVYN